MSAQTIIRKTFPRLTSRARNVLLVTGGATIGQGAVMLSMPIITRLYNPDTFGLYAVFTSAIGIFSTIIALHYELAIPLPRGEAEAKRLMKLALLIAAIFSSVVGIVIIIFKAPIFSVIQAQKLEPYVWLIPCVLVLNGVSILLTFWAIRKQGFRYTALSKIFQGVTQSVSQVVAGIFGGGLYGLVIGQVGGQIAGILALLRAAPKSWQIARRRAQGAQLWLTAKKYQRFPLITVWSSLINALSIQLPVLMLSLLFGPSVTGFFALSFRLLQMPVRLLGQSASQVFFSMAAEAHRENDLARVTRRIFRSMFSFALPTFVILGYVAPELTKIIFGEAWAEAGIYTQLLMPWIMFAFLSETLSVLVSVLHRQSQELLFQLGYLLCIFVSIIGGAFLGGTATVALLGILGGIFLLTKIFWLLSISGVLLRETMAFCLRECAIIAPSMLVLYVGKKSIPSELMVIAMAIALLSAIHFFNYRYRSIYGFRLQAQSD